MSANLQGADLREADLSGANLMGADVRGANFCGATLTKVKLTGVRWKRAAMSRKFRGIQDLESCYGNALFKRDAADQDYLDTLQEHWKSSGWKRTLFWAWGFFSDYGRSLSRVALLALSIAVIFAIIYSVWPELLGFETWGKDKFTPVYFSIVTYTTLGFGDITPKGHFWGEIIVVIEVIIGYATLGCLLAVLAEKLARRS
jgi:hypothetical protein